jgi:hypothetical protein
MRRYGTEILADPLMETNDYDRSLVDIYISEGVEEIKHVKPSLRFAPAMEEEEVLKNENSMNVLDVFQSPPEGISSSGKKLSKGMGEEESKMEDGDLNDEDEDYDDEDAKDHEGLMYAIGAVGFFALLSFVAKKLLACFGRLNEKNDDDLEMVVDNADRFADLAHVGEAVSDATSLAQTSASNASIHSSANSIGAVGGAANNPASSAAAAQ